MERCRTIIVATLGIALLAGSALAANKIPEDSILVAQRSNNIAVLDLQGNSPGGFAPGATPYDIVDVVRIPKTGEIVAADQKGRYRRYDKYGFRIGDYGGQPGTFHGQSLAVGPDGFVYAARQNGDNVVIRLNPKTGRQDRSITITDSTGIDRGNGLRGLTFGPDGFLYLVAFDQDATTTIRRVAADLSASTVFARSTLDTENRRSAGLVFGPDGDLYVTLTWMNQVERFDGKTGKSKGSFVKEGAGGLHHATGIMFHPKTGNLLVASFRTDQILEYDGSTGDFIGVFARVAGPWYFH